MADDKVYEVIAPKVTGKHKVYKKGEKMPESEVFGDIEVLTKGQNGVKRKRGTTTEILLPNVKPRLKLVGAPKKGRPPADKEG